MSSKLSIDILSIIFEDLEQENDETLYSCIFVNREWCQVAIPFLWKNPWKKFDENQRLDRYKILFKCFLMMMSKESKEFLKLNGMKFLFEDTSSQSNFSFSQTPLFNYASFCKVIDSIKIYKMINHNFIKNYRQYLVEQEILKLLIGSTSKLKILMLRHKSHSISSFPNSSISLSQLNEFHCDTSIDTTIFYGLSQLCRNIERLVIEGSDDDNHGLILFIKQQINLKRVKIWEEHKFRYNAQGQCKNLSEALATKASSIIELDLGQCVITIPPISLKDFQNNLTVFKFGIDYDLIEEGLYIKLVNILRDISLPNLQQLIIYDCPFDIVAKIVKKTNGGLKKIDVGPYLFNSEYVDILNSTIAKHCPKLELLSMWIDSLDDMLELINGCKELRGLVLQSVYYKKSTVDIFKILYNNASNHLRKLQLDGSWELSKETLIELFKNWNQQQRNALDFYVSSNIFKDEYEDIINNYQELGVIRNFNKYNGIHDFIDSWG